MKIYEDEQCIGTHTLNKEHTAIEHQEGGVEENRHMSIEYANKSYTTAMNTIFQKTEHKVIPYRHPGTNISPPYVRSDTTTTPVKPRFETLDYWLTINRWKNSVKNVETDITANITTDHFPMIATIRTKLKANNERARERDHRNSSPTGRAGSRKGRRKKRTSAGRRIPTSIWEDSYAKDRRVQQHDPRS